MSADSGPRPSWRRRLELALGSGPVPDDAGRGAGEGVRTRDHLANTRTFLSWMRLALTLVAVGYAVDKLGVVTARVEGRPLASEGGDRTTALLLVLSGGVLANLAFARFVLQRRVIDGPALRSRVLLDVTLMSIAGVVGVLVLLFLLRTG
jgi:putative membrane protein